MWYEATVVAAECDSDGVWSYRVQFHIDGDEVRCASSHIVLASEPCSSPNP